jgi:hypothetical protein
MPTYNGYNLINSGIGGFLCPPEHPSHNWHIGNSRDGISLESAIENNYAGDYWQLRAKEMIAEWQDNKLPLRDERVQDWIHQVLGYFGHSYRRPDVREPQCWHVDQLTNAGEMDDHAGVHLIRQYYPSFKTTQEHFAKAYWGKKKCT